MAFVRCWAEGIDPVLAWRRFMQVDGVADAQRARAVLARLLDELAALARANGRADIAALLRRNPQAIADSDPGLPTLDAFRAQHPPDFYSEAELTALYQAEHGRPPSDGAARRRQRLRERQVLAVQWLERLAVRDPSPGDRVAEWLDERLAARLGRVGLSSLADVSRWIAHHGAHWYRPIPRFGVRAAGRVQGWWLAHEASLGPLPDLAATVPRRTRGPALTGPPRADIVPLERFVPPAGLDGACGTNRAAGKACRIDANNDLDALRRWLLRHEAASATGRAYRKEAERFLLWAVLERHKPLSSIDGVDCLAYRRFLDGPPPSWCGPRNARRSSADWRPFEGPLSARSVTTALAILHSLFAWLVRQRYLVVNPWHDEASEVAADDVLDRAAMAPAAVAAARSLPQPPLRALTLAQWQCVQRWLADPVELPPGPAAQRLRFILTLAYSTGLRLGELVAARLHWLHKSSGPLAHEGVDVNGDEVWLMRVPGHDGQARDLPLHHALLECLRDYLVARQLDPDPLANPPATPLIARLNQNAPLSATHLHSVLVQAFGQCARSVERDDAAAAARIGQATPRWLRHTHGAHALALGVPQAVLQARLGHRSAQPTAVYAAAAAAPCQGRGGDR